MKNYQINRIILLFIILIVTPLYGQKSNEELPSLKFFSIPVEKDEKNSEEELVEEKSEYELMLERQLSEDKTIPIMEKGTLFIPYLVDGQREPSYLIYNEHGKYVKIGKPGHRVFLKPGKYFILIGSGPKSLRFKKEVIIKMEQLTVVKPDWSALVIDTVDQYGNRIRKGYLVYNEENKFLTVTGFGADASKGERTAVWILPPNLYRISKRGETADSLINYITVRTTLGKAAHVKVIYDTETGRILGGGETTDFFFFSGASGWSFNKE